MHALAQKLYGSHDVYQHLHPGAIGAWKTGWGGDNPLLREMVGRTKPAVIIEVGSYLGESAITMGQECRRLGLQTAVICVDTWLGGAEHWASLNRVNGRPTLYDQFLSNVLAAELRDTIIPIPISSEAAPLILAGRQIAAGLIYVDGSHEEEACYQDIARFQAVLKPGGIMFGHDYESMPGVNAAVKRYCRETGRKVKVEGGCWVLG